jgi:hypothetical protein
MTHISQTNTSQAANPQACLATSTNPPAPAPPLAYHTGLLIR